MSVLSLASLCWGAAKIFGGNPIQENVATLALDRHHSKQFASLVQTKEEEKMFSGSYQWTPSNLVAFLVSTFFQWHRLS